MSNLFGKLSSIFLNDGGAASPAQEEVKSQPEVTTPAVPPVPAAPVDVDQKIAAVIQEAYTKANLDGYDYAEFKQGITSLATMIPDEIQRFKAVFATATSMGITKEHLIDTAKHYIKTLQEEQDRFHLSIANETKERVEKVGEVILALKQKLDENQAAIDNLTQENAKIKDAIAEKTVQQNNSANEIETLKVQFGAALAKMESGIKSDIEKISTFIE